MGRDPIISEAAEKVGMVATACPPLCGKSHKKWSDHRLHPTPHHVQETLMQKTQQKSGTKILEDYLSSGAVKKVTDPENTRHLVPWFVLSKPEKEGVKHRLIADCRELNQFCSPEKFTMETMATIFPC
jgi:hypothetical protein